MNEVFSLLNFILAFDGPFSGTIYKQQPRSGLNGENVTMRRDEVTNSIYCIKLQCRHLFGNNTVCQYWSPYIYIVKTSTSSNK